MNIKTAALNFVFAFTLAATIMFAVQSRAGGIGDPVFAPERTAIIYIFDGGTGSYVATNDDADRTVSLSDKDDTAKADTPAPPESEDDTDEVIPEDEEVNEDNDEGPDPVSTPMTKKDAVHSWGVGSWKETPNAQGFRDAHLKGRDPVTGDWSDLAKK